MRGLTGLAAVAAMSQAFCGCGPSGPVDWSRQVHPDVLAKAGLQYYWRLPLELRRGEKLQRIHRLDENVYFLTSKNRLIAVDAARGVFKWWYDVANPRQTVFAPCHADGLLIPDKLAGIAEMTSDDKPVAEKPWNAVLINTLDRLMVLDRTTGREVRNVPLGFVANTGGASDGQMFYAGSVKGWYYAIRLYEAVKPWWGATEDMIQAAPVAYGGSLYVASRDGTFSAIRTLSGERAWYQDLGTPLTAGFHVDERGCFVPGEDNRIHAFETVSGQELWEAFICEGPIRRPIQVAATSIFQYAENDRFHAVNLVNGQKRWSLPEGRLVLAVLDQKVHLLDDARNLRIVDEVLGTQHFCIPMTGFDLFAANTTAPAIYVATHDGKVCCIRTLAAGHLTVEMLKPKGEEAPK